MTESQFTGKGECGTRAGGAASGQRPAGMLRSPAGRRGAGSWMLQQRRQGDSERCERSAVAGEGGAAQKSRRRQPGSFCRPGARTRGARGCGGTGAAGPPSCSAAAAGSRRWRNLEWGARPAQAALSAPAQLAGEGRGPHQGPAPGGALRASLLPSAGTGVGWGDLLPAPVREAWRLCPGMSGGAGGRRRDFPTCQTLAWRND